MSRKPESFSIATRIHGGYLLANGPRSADRETRGLLVGFHGYGENAERHLENLSSIPGSNEWTLCAVRALHRFYNTKTGDVIGSWMTSLDRELAIEDNIRYVAAVIDRVRSETAQAGPLVIAGFSQGVAMAYRAAQRCDQPCAGLIVLAGDVPPDVGERQPHSLPPILLGRGRSDQWYSEGKMNADLATLRTLEAEVETCVFDGGHEWAPSFLAASGAFLARLGEADQARSSSVELGQG